MRQDIARLNDIRDRLARASPGPWTLSKIPAHDADGEYCGCDIYLLDGKREEIGGLSLEDDAEFVTCAAEDIRWLLCLVAEQRLIVSDLEQESDAAREAIRYREALRLIATCGYGLNGVAKEIARRALKGEELP